ncbi:flexible cuticle protein 12-like [Battus philenor]|uniref:flexible cuticle protein 12-like n=1 Tax=Battus philenor TaxID=42288 RepID=UPI0035CF7940
MKLFIVVALFVAAAMAAPANPDGEAQIVRFSNDNIGVNGYNFDFETSNGIRQSEVGEVKNLGLENESLGVRGQYSYVGDDGKLYEIVYVADEEGFKPVGAHIPQAN